MMRSAPAETTSLTASAYTDTTEAYSAERER
jgi:hypothetical protein